MLSAYIVTAIATAVTALPVAKLNTNGQVANINTCNFPVYIESVHGLNGGAKDSLTDELSRLVGQDYSDTIPFDFKKGEGEGWYCPNPSG